MYSAHVLSTEAITAAMEDQANAVRQRATRNKKREEDENLGYHSYKRGDIVLWNATNKDEENIREIVFACMVFEHRSQQRRFLITYCAKVKKFSVNSWSAWKCAHAREPQATS